MLRRSVVLTTSLVLVACGGGGGPPPVTPDASVLPQPGCLDSDGDGVPGTGDCAAEPLVDCDDHDALVFPGAVEVCNGRDDDCDGQVDEALPVFTWYRDDDGDGFGSTRVGEGCGTAPAGAVASGGDCDDGDPLAYPGASERCNGRDDDCDGTADDGLAFQDYYPDADRDGFGDASAAPLSSCQPELPGYVTNALDCDDGNAAVRPNATEICNKVDDNCDGQVDNGIAFTAYYPDADGDGFGSATATPEMSCAPVPGKVTNNEDCDDTRAAAKPGGVEVCNGLDDDCDGVADDGLTFTDYYLDADGDGFGALGSTPLSACLPVPGRVPNALDCNDASAAVRPGATESCNGVDDDCNGQIDDGLTFVTYYPDVDGDGFGAASATGLSACAPVAGRVPNNQDCDDANASIRPMAPEVCNGVDDNCNGQVDEGLTFTDYYPDADGDGFGAAGATPISSCTPITGRVTNATDCNDANSAINPSRAEVCNQVDDNCNGQVDEGLPTQSYYLDADGDTYGRANSTPVASCGPVAGRVTNSADCDDTNPDVFPGAPEQCNGRDDNCNGLIDDGVATQDYWVDADGDGFGAAGTTPLASCSAIVGRVTNAQDCNDSNAAIKPTATEVCNDVDDDCDGLIDEGLTFLNYYPDLDGDGYGASAAAAQSSCRPVTGKVTNNQDCNDTNANIRPGVAEVCNQVDDNCNGQVDEGLPTQSYWVDADNDGYGAAGGTAVVSCAPVSGRVTNNQDCNDANANINPARPEACNGVDDNCNGQVDEGNPGGGAACSTGQSGVCAAGTLQCQSAAIVCVRNVAPSTEMCNGLDDNCNGQVDEGFTGLGAACSAGLGVCQRTGTNVCNAAGTGVQCSVTAGSPTAPACDGLDNDCDGVVDEPFLASTADITPTAWSDLEVAPYYFSSGGCQGGAVGSGSDALAGGALLMAGGTAGVAFQRLTTAGAPTGAVSSVSSFTYSDVALAQAGDGFVIAGIWASNNAEIDLFYVDANGTQRTLRYTQFKEPSGCSGTACRTLDSLRVVRGNGRRVTLLWREVGTGLRLAQVEACFVDSAWSLRAPGCASTTLTSTLVVSSTAALAGVGADSSHVDWASSQSCPATSAQQRLGVAYVSGPTAVSFFRVDENGANKAAETVAYSTTSPRVLAEPDVSFFRDGSGGDQFFLAYVTRDPSTTPARADLNYWLTNDPTWHYAWLDYATEGGVDSISRPRTSASSVGLWMSAVRHVADASGFKRQVMTRTSTLSGARTPLGTAVEFPVTSGACTGDPACRPGEKAGVTNWLGFGRLYTAFSGATPAGTAASVLTCQ